MTGEQFINEVMFETDRHQNLETDTIYREMALRWLNRVIKDISTRQTGFHWRFLEKTAYLETVAEQMSYSLPDDIDGYKILSVHRKDPEMKIDYVDQRIFDEFIPDPDTSSGNPDYYTLWGDAIKLWPIPSSDGQKIYVRYIKEITTLADNDTGTNDIPQKWDDMVVQGILVRAFKYDGKVNEMALSQQEYERGLIRMEEENGLIIDAKRVARSHGVEFGTTPWVTPAGI